jgi:glycosyltransferase involved in cell wall biosynthesis
MEPSDPNLTHPIKLSVVIPCYNHGEFILEAIASVESCQENVYEILIINDGSTDPLTEKVLAAVADKGYQVIHQKNQGLAVARNHGIELAKGRYILPLDADNKIRPDYITTAIDILDCQPEVGVVYGNFEFFGGVTGIKEVPEFDINVIVRGNYIDACAVFRKTVWQDAGGYDDKIPEQFGYEDWDFWLGAAEKGWHFYHLDEVLFDYRLRSQSMVSRCNIPENRRELFRYISTKHIGLYSTNFANIFANLECDHLKERDRREELEYKLEKLQRELDQERSQFQDHLVQLRETQSTLAQCEAELKQTKTKLEENQDELKTIQIEKNYLKSELDRFTLEKQQSEANLQAELARSQTDQESLKTELTSKLQQTEAQWQHQFAEKVGEFEQVRHELQSQLDATQNQLGQTQAELASSQTQLQRSQEMIQAMKTSKFWQLRTTWFKIKQAFGLATD